MKIANPMERLMAGDWIKKRNDLHEDPAVIAIFEATECVDEDHVVGKLCKFWTWVSEQSRDGHALSVTQTFVDRFVGVTGFAQALISVGWLEGEDNNFSIPNFDHHLGTSAKNRAQSTIRSQKYREKNVRPASRKASRTERDESVTREEKRREEKRLKKDSTNVESCEHPAAEAPGSPQLADITVLEFPIVGKSRRKVWLLTEGKLAEYRESFPALDVDTEVRAALQWCRDNAGKRKTATGMPAFLTRWLSRAQNSGRGSGGSGGSDQPALEFTLKCEEQ